MDEYKNLVNMEKCQHFIKELSQIIRNLCGLKFSRFMLFLVNSCFVIIGTLLGVAAVFSLWNEYVFRAWIDLSLVAGILVAVATIMMFVAFLGAFASSRECAVLTNFYWLVLLIFFIISVNAAITTSIISTSFSAKMENNMIQSIKNSNSEWELEKWMTLQKRLDCCGAQGPEDWYSLKVKDGLNYTTNGNTYVVPFSCCFIRSTSSGVVCDHAYYGCISPVTDIFDICLIVLGIVAGVSMILQILGMIFASLHVRNIRRFKTAEEMKKQELQHLLFNEESTK